MQSSLGGYGITVILQGLCRDHTWCRFGDMTQQSNEKEHEDEMETVILILDKLVSCVRA